MLISKKELLKITGISYGQLYRWKRERLIPEEWFIKQPSFTGQETFFPREKMLKRVETIQELKTKYSLEELAKILSPEVADRNFTTDDLSIIDEIDVSLIPTLVKGFRKNNFTYIEVLLMVSLCKAKKEFEEINNMHIVSLIEGIREYCNRIKSTGYVMIIFNKETEYYASIYQEEADVYFDKKFKLVTKIRLDDISNQIKLKYRKSFNFNFESENDINDEKEVSL